MIVVDSSAWIDLIRDRRTAVAHTLDRLIVERADLAVTEAVVMEVLAGATTPGAFVQTRSLLLGLPVLRLEGLADFEEAARIYRACRAGGDALHSHVDCLVAVPTIRHGASLLHNDRDFEKMARHTALRLEPIDDRSPDAGAQESKGRWRRRTRARRKRVGV